MFEKIKKLSSKPCLNLKSGSFYIPKDTQSKPKGEDAHFICDEKRTIGVADGVGGYAKHMIDSGVYARELMSNSVEVIKNRFSGSKVAVNPEQVLSEAHAETKAKGGSTACIITLEDNVVHAVNVGDSGFMIIRRGKTFYKSPVQLRSFNCPYYLSNNVLSNRLRSADMIKVGVEVGDVIVAGSDGLFDNMFTEEIALRVRQLGDSIEPEYMASIIAEFALFNSYDADSVTPFQVASMRSSLSKKHRRGGKIDDITVIVSFVMPPSLQLVDQINPIKRRFRMVLVEYKIWLCKIRRQWCNSLQDI